MKYLEILFWKIAKRIIIRGYGTCDKTGTDCGACKATRMVDWIDEHIDLLKL